jgi:hypothetical protein
MFSKILISLTSAVVLGSASAAFAVEDPESRLADRYPFLEKVATTRGAAHKMVIARQSAGALANVEVPENRIGDRYPWLEPGAKPIIFALTSGRLVESASVQVDDPESKLADRFPWLEPKAPQRAMAIAVTGRGYKVVRKQNGKGKV